MPHKPHAVHSTHPAIVKRLSRAVGHLQGIIRMIEAKKSCPDVLQQMSAVIAAIESSRKVFLEDHIRGCILEAVRTKDSQDALKELERALALMS